jgi:imidazolonepropionase-like amidohydrolase
VHAHCYRADEILMLIRVADEMGFKVRTFQHVLEGYKVAKEIAAHGAGASTFSDWWSYKVEAFDAIPYNAAIMSKFGVTVSLNSDDAELMRHLNSEAGKTMKYGGMTENEALAMVTLNPAKQLGIDNKVGSIEVGKDADLVIYDKFPLSDYAKVQKVLIDGSVYFDRDKEVSSRAAKDADKQKLLDKLKQQNQTQQPTGGRRGGRGGE